MSADVAPSPATVQWELWGTYAYLAVPDPAALSSAEAIAVAVLADIETACSSFRPDSELSRLNARPGVWRGVSDLFAGAMAVALEAAEVTDGLVSPVLGRPLAQWGFIPAGTAMRTAYGVPQTVSVAADAWREIRLEPSPGSARCLVPVGVSLDLGATAKAWAADVVAGQIAGELGVPVVVSLGGDVRLAGPADADLCWPVAISEKPGEAPRWVGTLNAAHPGLATSTLTHRTRSRKGAMVSHVIDPRSGRPLLPRSAPIRTAAAFAHTAVAANTLTTWALVNGRQAEAGLSATSAVPDLLISGSGRTAWMSERLTCVDGEPSHA